MLQIEATVLNHPARGRGAATQVTVQTNGRRQSLAIPEKPDGQGLATNGGELLCLALGTCFCNDLYREASGRGIAVAGAEVTVRSVFGGVGEPARELAYSVRVWGDAGEGELRALVSRTDEVAEIHNTLRRGMPVTLERVEIGSADALVPADAARDGG